MQYSDVDAFQFKKGIALIQEMNFQHLTFPKFGAKCKLKHGICPYIGPSYFLYYVHRFPDLRSFLGANNGSRTSFIRYVRTKRNAQQQLFFFKNERVGKHLEAVAKPALSVNYKWTCIDFFWAELKSGVTRLAHAAHIVFLGEDFSVFKNGRRIQSFPAKERIRLHPHLPELVGIHAVVGDDALAVLILENCSKKNGNRNGGSSNEFYVVVGEF